MSNKLIVIPTYNESENIENLIDQLSPTDCHILVVDDSSPDNTGKLVKSHKLFNKSLYLIERSENRGYAPSCIEGMNYGIKNQYSNIIQMDADFSLCVPGYSDCCDCSHSVFLHARIKIFNLRSVRMD